MTRITRRFRNLPRIGLLAALAVALAGCHARPVGWGVSSGWGYPSWGYSSVHVVHTAPRVIHTTRPAPRPHPKPAPPKPGPSKPGPAKPGGPGPGSTRPHPSKPGPGKPSVVKPGNPGKPSGPRPGSGSQVSRPSKPQPGPGASGPGGSRPQPPSGGKGRR